MYMTSAQVRQAFFDFFKERGHQWVPSSSLVPANDATLLFTNAGMVQFKEVFLGLESRSYKRAVTSQRCVRAGGKHNDLENVGYTARHHTFFEMLGNFSFGDYFKREAIAYAWEFLTEVLGLPPEKLWVTVYNEDKEAADIWLKVLKVSSERFSYCGEKDNFWSMGDTGPCGPCSEIFYDHGADIPGGPPGSPDEDGDRYIEIWNLVFMQYNRDASGQLSPLPKPSVDTGMGLERIVAVVQGVHNNYDIDMFRHIGEAVGHLTGQQDLSNQSLRVISDHIRSSAFLIVDGVVPSNEGRGYVLRRIIRRAIRHGNKLGMTAAFFHKLLPALIEQMSDAYPELKESAALIERLLKKEEQQFSDTLNQGLKILEQHIVALEAPRLTGDIIFKLYDTYGFPVDLTADIARELSLTMDYAGFDALMAHQRKQSQAASRFGVDYNEARVLEMTTTFLGYETLSTRGQVLALIADTDNLASLEAGQKAMVVLDKTTFYAESGGQVGDKGELHFKEGIFSVEDTIKSQEAYLHVGCLTSGKLQVGDVVETWVDTTLRQATALNHSATHLLHAALRRLLGSHVTQKGSLVEPARLRFDFSHFEPLTPIEIQQVERLVNTQIRKNHQVKTALMQPEKAIEAGAIALFGEKYADEVRVLSMGDFSRELCGGTHVKATGEIGLFKITTETSIAAGVRRIEAVTGEKAWEYINEQELQLQKIAATLKSSTRHLHEKVHQLVERNKIAEKETARLQRQLAQDESQALTSDVVYVGDIAVLAVNLENTDVKAMRDMLDQLKNTLGTAAIVLASVKGEKVLLVAGVTMIFNSK